MTGLCQCGCGVTTRIAGQTDPRYGSVKGQPRRFIKGHDKRSLSGHRITTQGYVAVYLPGHPRATKGFVLQHVVMVERVLGRPLPGSAIVHHVNDNKQDNRSDNFAVLENHAEHRNLHHRRAVLRAGGNPWAQRVCCYCHTPKDFSAFYQPKDRAFSAACRECARARALQNQRRRSA